jgi:hypothetical protein
VPPEQEYEELHAPVAEDIIFSAALSCFSPKNNDDDAANAPKAASLFRNSLLSICKWFLMKTQYCRFSKHVRAKLQIIWVIPTAREQKQPEMWPGLPNIAYCQNTEHIYAKLPKKSTPNYRKLE